MFETKAASPVAAPPTFEVHEMLEGLNESLIEALASLNGSTEDDLLVTFQVMPWGDRATLAAYGVVTLMREGGVGRVAAVAPVAVELTAAAAEYVAVKRPQRAQNDSEKHGVGGLLAAAALPLVDIRDDEATSDAAMVVPGIVETVEVEALEGIKRIVVRVPLATLNKSTGGPDTTRVQFAAWLGTQLEVGAVVKLTYGDEESSLQHPTALLVTA